MVLSELVAEAQQFIDNLVEQVQQVLDNPTTEQGQFLFQTLAGIGGFGAGAVAAERLSSVPNSELELVQILTPALLSAGVSTVAAFLVPTSRQG